MIFLFLLLSKREIASYVKVLSTDSPIILMPSQNLYAVCVYSLEKWACNLSAWICDIIFTTCLI